MTLCMAMKRDPWYTFSERFAVCTTKTHWLSNVPAPNPK